MKSNQQIFSELRQDVKFDEILWIWHLILIPIQLHRKQELVRDGDDARVYYYLVNIKFPKFLSYKFLRNDKFWWKVVAQYHLGGLGIGLLYLITFIHLCYFDIAKLSLWYLCDIGRNFWCYIDIKTPPDRKRGGGVLNSEYYFRITSP